MIKSIIYENINMTKVTNSVLYELCTIEIDSVMFMYIVRYNNENPHSQSTEIPLTRILFLEFSSLYEYIRLVTLNMTNVKIQIPTHNNQNQRNCQ